MLFDDKDQFKLTRTGLRDYLQGYSMEVSRLGFPLSWNEMYLKPAGQRCKFHLLFLHNKQLLKK